MSSHLREDTYSSSSRRDPFQSAEESIEDEHAGERVKVNHSDNTNTRKTVTREGEKKRKRNNSENSEKESTARPIVRERKGAKRPRSGAAATTTLDAAPSNDEDEDIPDEETISLAGDENGDHKDQGEEDEGEQNMEGEEKQTEAEFFSYLVQCGDVFQASCLPTLNEEKEEEGQPSSSSPSIQKIEVTPTLTWPVTTAFQTAMWYLLRYADIALSSQELSACQKVLEMTLPCASPPAPLPAEGNSGEAEMQKTVWRQGTDASELLLRLCFTHGNRRRPLRTSPLPTKSKHHQKSDTTTTTTTNKNDYVYYVFSRTSLQQKLGGHVRLEDALQRLQETEFIANENGDTETEADVFMPVAEEVEEKEEGEDGEENGENPTHLNKARLFGRRSSETKKGKVYLFASRVLTRYDGGKLAQLFISQQGHGGEKMTTKQKKKNAFHHDHKKAYADRCLLYAFLRSLRAKVLKDFATALRLVYTRLLIGTDTTTRQAEGKEPPTQKQSRSSNGPPPPPQTRTVDSFFGTGGQAPRTCTEESDESVLVLTEHQHTSGAPPLRESEVEQEEEAEGNRGDSGFMTLVPSRKRDIIQYLMHGHFKLKVQDAAAAVTATTVTATTTTTATGAAVPTTSSAAVRSATFDDEKDAYYIKRVWKEYIDEEFYLLHRTLKETIYSLGELFQVLTLQHAAPCIMSSSSLSLSLSVAAMRSGKAEGDHGDGRRHTFLFSTAAAAAAAPLHVYYSSDRVPPLLLTRAQHMWAYYFSLFACVVQRSNTKGVEAPLKDGACADKKSVDIHSLGTKKTKTEEEAEAKAKEKVALLSSSSWNMFPSLPPWWRTGASPTFQCPPSSSCSNGTSSEEKNRIHLFTSAAALRAYRAALAYYELLLPLCPEHRGTMEGPPLTPLQRRQVKDREFILSLYREIMKETEQQVRRRDRKKEQKQQRQEQHINEKQMQTGEMKEERGNHDLRTANVDANRSSKDNSNNSNNIRTIDTVLREEGLLAEHLLYFVPLFRFCSCLELLFPLLQSVKLYEEAICCLQFLLHTPVYILSPTATTTTTNDNNKNLNSSGSTFSFYYRPHKKGHYYHRWAQNLVHLKQKESAFYLLKAFHEKSILPLFPSHQAAATAERAKKKVTSLRHPSSSSSASSALPFKKTAGGGAAGTAGEAFPSEEVQRAMHLYVQQVYQEEEVYCGLSPATAATEHSLSEAHNDKCRLQVEKTFPPSVQRRARFLKSLWPSTASGSSSSSSSASRSSPLAVFHSILEYLYLERYCGCSDRVAIEKTLFLLAKPFYKWTPVPTCLFCYSDSLWRNKGNHYLPQALETPPPPLQRNRPHDKRSTKDHAVRPDREVVEEVNIIGTRSLCTLREEASYSTLDPSNNRNASGSTAVPGGVWRGFLRRTDEERKNTTTATTATTTTTTIASKNNFISEITEIEVSCTSHLEDHTPSGPQEVTNTAEEDDSVFSLQPTVREGDGGTQTASSPDLPCVLTAGRVEEYALAVLLHQLNQAQPRYHLQERTETAAKRKKYIWRGLHCEGAWFRLLADALLWDIYRAGAPTAAMQDGAGVPAAGGGGGHAGSWLWLTPLQEGHVPLDRATSSCLFLMRRRAAVAARLDACAKLSKTEFVAYIRRILTGEEDSSVVSPQEERHTKSAAAAAAAASSSPAIPKLSPIFPAAGYIPLLELVAAAPQAALIALLRRTHLSLLSDGFSSQLSFSGFPDLVVWRARREEDEAESVKTMNATITTTATATSTGREGTAAAPLSIPSAVFSASHLTDFRPWATSETKNEGGPPQKGEREQEQKKEDEEEEEAALSFLLVEVKGPGDSLSVKQMVMLDALRRDGLDVRVAFVRDEGDNGAVAGSSAALPNDYRTAGARHHSSTRKSTTTPTTTATKKRRVQEKGADTTVAPTTAAEMGDSALKNKQQQDAPKCDQENKEPEVLIL